MTTTSNVNRRTVIAGVAGVAASLGLAGCSTSDDGGGDGGSVDTGQVDEYLSDTSNYDGIVDRTGRDGVTVDVGVEANNGNFGFGPPAIRVDDGTTVTWEWTGSGGEHNVAAEDGDFQSETTAEAGFTFEQTVEGPGVILYRCIPHQGLGMKGAIVVE